MIVVLVVFALLLPPGCVVAPAALNRDPEHNAYVQGRSDIDPFHVGAAHRRVIAC